MLRRRSAQTFTSSVASGDNAISLATGQRLDFGGGTNDYMVSDGTNITMPTGGGFTIGDAIITRSASGTLAINAGTGVLATPVVTGNISLGILSNRFYCSSAAAPLQLGGNMTDGGTAVGVVIAADTTLATSGSKIASIRNVSSEKAYFDKDGQVSAAGYGLVVGQLGATQGLASSGSNTYLNTPAGFLIGLRNASGLEFGNFNAAGLNLPPLAGTAGSGTGITANSTAQVCEFVHKITVTEAALTDADTSQDVTLWTVPAKTKIQRVIAHATADFTGGGNTAVTVSVGTTGTETIYLVANSIFSGTPVLGDAEAELGTALAGGIGHIPSFTGTTAIVARFTSTTGTVGGLTTGSVTFYIEGVVYP